MTSEEIKNLKKLRVSKMKELLLEGYTIKDLSIIFNKHVEDIEKSLNND